MKNNKKISNAVIIGITITVLLVGITVAVITARKIHERRQYKLFTENYHLLTTSDDIEVAMQAYDEIMKSNSDFILGEENSDHEILSGVILQAFHDSTDPELINRYGAMLLEKGCYEQVVFEKLIHTNAEACEVETPGTQEKYVIFENGFIPYDRFNRSIKTRDAEGHTVLEEYEDGTYTVYSYDDNDRMTKSETFRPEQQDNETVSIEYGYDRIGRIAESRYHYYEIENDSYNDVIYTFRYEEEFPDAQFRILAQEPDLAEYEFIWEDGGRDVLSYRSRIVFHRYYMGIESREDKGMEISSFQYDSEGRVLNEYGRSCQYLSNSFQNQAIVDCLDNKYAGKTQMWYQGDKVRKYICYDSAGLPRLYAEPEKGEFLYNTCGVSGDGKVVILQEYRIQVSDDGEGNEAIKKMCLVRNTGKTIEYILSPEDVKPDKE